MNRFLSFWLVLALPLFLSAQQNAWDIGASIGFTSYHGDLVMPSFTDFKETGVSYGINGRFHFKEGFSVRADILQSQLTGNDNNYKEREDRNFEFETPYTQIYVQLEWEPFAFRRFMDGGVFRRTVSPYFFVGGGVNLIDPETNLADLTESNSEILPGIQADLNNDIPSVLFAVPAGLGIKIDILESLFLGIEGGMIFPFSDYLDGISEAGNPDEGDNVIFGQVALGYRIFKANKKKKGKKKSSSK